MTSTPSKQTEICNSTMGTKSSGGMGEEIRGNPCLGLKRHACASSERGRDETEYIIQTSVIDAALLTIKQTISYAMKAPNIA